MPTAVRVGTMVVTGMVMNRIEITTSRRTQDGQKKTVIDKGTGHALQRREVEAAVANAKNLTVAAAGDIARTRRQTEEVMMRVAIGDTAGSILHTTRKRTPKVALRETKIMMTGLDRHRPTRKPTGPVATVVAVRTGSRTRSAGIGTRTATVIESETRGSLAIGFTATGIMTGLNETATGRRTAIAIGIVRETGTGTRTERTDQRTRTAETATGIEIETGTVATAEARMGTRTRRPSMRRSASRRRQRAAAVAWGLTPRARERLWTQAGGAQ
jgi:hypothetical protein